MTRAQSCIVPEVHSWVDAGLMLRQVLKTGEQVQGGNGEDLTRIVLKTKAMTATATAPKAPSQS